MTQSDQMNQIEKKWFGKKITHQYGSSDSSEASSSSVDLSYFRSLFLITASAAIFALTLYFFRFIRNQRFVEKNHCFWRRIIAAIILHIFTTKDDHQEGPVDAEPPVAVAVVAVEASPSTNTPLSASNDSSLERFNKFGNSNLGNQASIEI